MVDLSIIIISYNTKEITKKCLDSLLHALKLCQKTTYEIIVVDNNSSDGSQELIQMYPVKPIFLSKNIGFGRANNKGLAHAKGKFTLYLNSDVIHNNVNYDELLAYMANDKNIGSLTVKVNLTPDTIDPASHRGFPTLWRTFTYYSKLEQLTASVPYINSIFGGYHLMGKDLNEVHEVDAISGAYFLARTKMLQRLGGFDEDFFMYGEDLDLNYRIKEAGYKNIYYPKYDVTHLKYQSGIKTKNEVISKEIKRHFYHSMKIFYQKHYQSQYPGFVNSIVYSIINTIMKRI